MKQTLSPASSKINRRIHILQLKYLIIMKVLRKYLSKKESSPKIQDIQ
jgi:hypothetical protein